MMQMEYEHRVKRSKELTPLRGKEFVVRNLVSALRQIDVVIDEIDVVLPPERFKIKACGRLRLLSAHDLFSKEVQSTDEP